MRVLVSGATGYLGAEIIAGLLDSGAAVIAWGRDHERLQAIRRRFAAWSDSLQTEAGTLLEMPAVPLGVDAVIHAAALRPPTAESDVRSLQRVNIEGTRQVARLAERAHCERLVYLSTQAVYGSRGAPWTEEAPVRPETEYARSKLAGEREALRMMRGRASILRVSRIYGMTPFARWEELPGRFALAVVRGHALPIYGTGEQRFDLIHVRDVARAAVLAATAPEAGDSVVYNVGGGGSVSLNELAQIFTALAIEHGLPSVTVERSPEAAGDARHLELDVTKIRTALGWWPEISLRDGLAEYLIQAGRSGRK